MVGKFERKTFSQIDINDPFFSPLKKDYPEFESSWFPKGVKENREALVFSDETGLGAFVALKHENESIPLQDQILPPRPRLKICTLLLAERFRSQRLGEGALGLALWAWQQAGLEEIYLTVFPQHDDLISQLDRFGFISVGLNRRGERVYLRSRKSVDYSDPYKAFPFVSPNFPKGGYLIVEDTYHDTLFPYSELKNALQEQLDKDVANGVSKVYIGNQWAPHYNPGDPIFVYRKHTGPIGKPRFKSCLTSFCVVTDVIAVKRSNRNLMSFEEFCNLVGNKSVFSEADLRSKYVNDRNLTIVKMLYCGYFGPGHNKNMDWLANNGLWAGPQEYPANIQLSPQQCRAIWSAGEIDVDQVFGG